jgi:GH24 family phage-related lysozyme (muramidase)
MRRTTWKGIAFIANREALVTTAYPDGFYDDGTQKWSIGYGSQTPTVHEGDTITVDEAIQRLKVDVEEREKDVARLVPATLPPHQFDALVSLYYQTGYKRMKAVAKLLSENDVIEAGRLMLSDDYITIKDNKTKKWRRSKGLFARRAREAALIASGEYGDLSTVPYWDGPPTAVIDPVTGEIVTPAAPRQEYPFPAEEI